MTAIVLNPLFEELFFQSDSFQSGLRMFKEIIATDRYLEILLDNTGDVVKPNKEVARAILWSIVVTISITELADHLDAYAMVCREGGVNEIFLNPLLLMQMLLTERRGATVAFIKKAALFIAIKLTHEFSHVAHPLLSDHLRMQVRSVNFGGGGKIKMRTPERSKAGAIFSDYGEMVEFDMCGGIMEIYTRPGPQPLAYFIDELILFEHPTARVGRLVLIKETDYTITNNLAELRLDLGPTIDQYCVGARGHLRFPAPGAVAESDIISNEDNEVQLGVCDKEATY